MPLSAAQRQAGDADLARRRAQREYGERLIDHAVNARKRVHQLVLTRHDLLDGLKTLADALVIARQEVAIAAPLVNAVARAKDEAIKRAEEAEDERDALRAELAAHRCRAGLAED